MSTRSLVLLTLTLKRFRNDIGSLLWARSANSQDS